MTDQPTDPITVVTPINNGKRITTDDSVLKVTQLNITSYELMALIDTGMFRSSALRHIISFSCHLSPKLIILVVRVKHSIIHQSPHMVRCLLKFY